MLGVLRNTAVINMTSERLGATGLAEIPDIPDDTEVVCLRSNRLSKLQTDDFSNLRSCVDLDLGKNQISEIEFGAFRGLDSLTELHLDENSLTELRPDMFLGLDALEKLMVGKNSITVVQTKDLWWASKFKTIISYEKFHH